MCLFDVLIALDVQKLKKNEYFCIFLSFPIYCRYFPIHYRDLAKRCFQDLADIFPETIFETLV